jgi:hypothetical protein
LPLKSSILAKPLFFKGFLFLAKLSARMAYNQKKTHRGEYFEKSKEIWRLKKREDLFRPFLIMERWRMAAGAEPRRGRPEGSE